jgi:hypothetical protein
VSPLTVTTLPWAVVAGGLVVVEEPLPEVVEEPPLEVEVVLLLEVVLLEVEVAPLEELEPVVEEDVVAGGGGVAAPDVPEGELATVIVEVVLGPKAASSS